MSSAGGGEFGNPLRKFKLVFMGEQSGQSLGTGGFSPSVWDRGVVWEYSNNITLHYLYLLYICNVLAGGDVSKWSSLYRRKGWAIYSDHEHSASSTSYV
ncbi:hypothetical protein XELAEV_18041990mg [Xenopus laevis]|uniref:Uncharacterized protein n=1 Tax=Xenopus laevis TaxID=8355 RepID=A0A974H5P0_XENLA|nr:hypothetical protein XELAEV_18041990mg [Xenopus laevis]